MSRRHLTLSRYTKTYTKTNGFEHTHRRILVLEHILGRIRLYPQRLELPLRFRNLMMQVVLAPDLGRNPASNLFSSLSSLARPTRLVLGLELLQRPQQVPEQTLPSGLVINPGLPPDPLGLWLPLGLRLGAHWPIMRGDCAGLGQLCANGVGWD